jgi:hypothetical protein
MDLEGKKVVFTGFNDADLKVQIENAGGQVTTSISGQTNILVVEGSKGENSAKSLKAKQMGVQIITKEAFLENLVKPQKKGVSNWFENLFRKQEPPAPRVRVPKSYPADKITKSTSFLTLDNGGRSFNVVLTPTSFSVFKRRQITKKERSDNKGDWEILDKIIDGLKYDVCVVRPTKYIRVFVGVSPDHGQKFAGNSILVQLNKKKYMFIGEQIDTFEVNDDIVGYLSPVGNSGVPYPYAVGVKNTYLMIEDTYLPNNMITEDDPYMQFYGHHLGKDVGHKTLQKMMTGHKNKYKFKRKMVEKRFEQW